VLLLGLRMGQTTCPGHCPGTDRRGASVPECTGWSRHIATSRGLRHVEVVDAWTDSWSPSGTRRVGHTRSSAARELQLRKCREFETDHGDITVRQSRRPKSHKIDMSSAARRYTWRPRDLDVPIFPDSRPGARCPWGHELALGGVRHSWNQDYGTAEYLCEACHGLPDRGGRWALLDVAPRHQVLEDQVEEESRLQLVVTRRRSATAPGPSGCSSAPPSSATSTSPSANSTAAPFCSTSRSSRDTAAAEPAVSSPPPRAPAHPATSGAPTRSAPTPSPSRSGHASACPARARLGVQPPSPGRSRARERTMDPLVVTTTCTQPRSPGWCLSGRGPRRQAPSQLLSPTWLWRRATLVSGGTRAPGHGWGHCRTPRTSPRRRRKTAAPGDRADLRSPCPGTGGPAG